MEEKEFRKGMWRVLVLGKYLIRFLIASPHIIVLLMYVYSVYCVKVYMHNTPIHSDTNTLPYTHTFTVQLCIEIVYTVCAHSHTFKVYILLMIPFDLHLVSFRAHQISQNCTRMTLQYNAMTKKNEKL